MSKKTELVKLFVEYKGKYEAIQAKAMEIDKSTMYTPVGREEAMKQLVESFRSTVESYHNKAVEIINNGLDELAEKWRKASAGKLTDSGYQAGLANVIKMLEVGAIREKEDIQNIIDIYACDFNALAVIKKMLHDSSIKEVKECETMVPEDNRSKNKELLVSLRNNVDKYININTVSNASKSWNAFNQGVTYVSSSMLSMAEFVTERLGDDLSLIK